MKRHESLAPLSRDHHHTLILAQLLKKYAPAYKGLPVAAKEKAKYANQQFESKIKPHFEQEEIILEKAKQHHPHIKELAAEVRNEHRQLEKLFLSLSNETNLEETLDKLGRSLEAHIRKEERILFPLLQEHCPEELLQEINMLLH